MSAGFGSTNNVVGICWSILTRFLLFFEKEKSLFQLSALLRYLSPCDATIYWLMLEKLVQTVENESKVSANDFGLL